MMMNVFEIWKQITTLNFCYFATPQQMNIRLLHTEYYAYRNVYYELKRKYPDYKDYSYIDEYNLFPEIMKSDIKKYTKKQELIRDRLIENVKLYSKNYPDEKIAQNRFLKEYEEFPYRLHQNIPFLMEDLE